MKGTTDCEACKKMLDNLTNMSDNQDDKDEQEKNSGDGNEEGNDSCCGGQGNEPGESGESGDSSEPGSGGEPGDGQGSGGDGTLEHTCENFGICCSGVGQKLTEKQKNQFTHKWQQEIIGAAEYHNDTKGKDSLPGWVSDFIVEITAPKVHWTDKIKSTATQVFRGRYTYKKLNRRGHAMRLCMPGRDPETKGVVCMLDSSGSMSDKEINQCLSEIVGIMAQCNCAFIYIIFYDVPVYHAEIYEKDTIKNLKLSRGGTSHTDAFKVIDGSHKEFKFDETPGMIVAFTDMDSDIPNLVDPGIPVIWANTGRSRGENAVPFGHIVDVEV